MARKRQRRQRAAAAAAAEHGNVQGHHYNTTTPGGNGHGNGVTVNIRQINHGDEGVLYTHKITVSQLLFGVEHS